MEEGHTIVPDGYDVGRDLLVQKAVGTTCFDGVTYSTTAQNITGLMLPGSVGVNHGEYHRPSFYEFWKADIGVGIAVDGIVTLLTVSIE